MLQIHIDWNSKVIRLIILFSRWQRFKLKILVWLSISWAFAYFDLSRIRLKHCGWYFFEAWKMRFHSGLLQIQHYYFSDTHNAMLTPTKERLTLFRFKNFRVHGQESRIANCNQSLLLTIPRPNILQRKHLSLSLVHCQEWEWMEFGAINFLVSLHLLHRSKEPQCESTRVVPTQTHMRHHIREMSPYTTPYPAPPLSLSPW